MNIKHIISIRIAATILAPAATLCQPIAGTLVGTVTDLFGQPIRFPDQYTFDFPLSTFSIDVDAALYEIIPASRTAERTIAVGNMKYQMVRGNDYAYATNELLEIRQRYKNPDADTSRLLAQTLPERDFGNPSENIRFAASVAGFGLLLAGFAHKGGISCMSIRELAENAMGENVNGEKKGFIELIDAAEKLLANGSK